MTTNERKYLLGGAGIGVLIAVLGMGAIAVRPTHPPAPAAPVSQSHAETATPAGSPQETAGGVQLTPEEITAAGVQLAEVRTARVKTELEAFGRVEQPEAQLAAISARVGGRIDRLYVQYTGQEVRRGQAVAEIYSPEVATALDEYRLALENRERMKNASEPVAREQAAELVDASRRRLELWGIDARQIDAASTQGPLRITTHATVSGTVVERKVAAGQYVQTGDTLFTVADLNEVWVKADVYESQLSQVRRQQAVAITSESLPGVVIHGAVDFIEPTANADTRTIPVHVHVRNPGMRLRPGMFVRARFVLPAAAETLVVPRSAVLDSGSRKIVFIAKDGGFFEARTVEVAAPGEEFYPVLRGVKLGEKVVTNGNFLIDSQTRLSGGMSALFGGAQEFQGNGQSAAPAAQPPKEQPKETAKLTFSVDPNPPKGASEAMFHVTLTGADGSPIPGAKVTVTLVMPAMPSMSMPEMRSTYDVPWAGGMYMGKGTIPTAGSWTVTVEATRNGERIATYRTRLTAK